MGDSPKLQTFKEEAESERMLKWFAFEHLPAHLQATSQQFALVAHNLVHTCKPGPERTIALRKLLESKDAAVRATLHPGG